MSDYKPTIADRLDYIEHGLIALANCDNNKCKSCHAQIKRLRDEINLARSTAQRDSKP